MGPAEDLREALEPTVRAAGLSLWDVERSASLVRVLIDRPEGVDLDAIAAVSAPLSAVLDERDDLVPGANYQLEVSSPGVERALRRAEQFQRFIGSEVAIKTSTPVAGARRLSGTLLEAGDEAVKLAVSEADGTPTRSDDEVVVELDNIQRAHTVFRWGPGPSGASPNRDGSAKGGSSKASRTRSGPDGRAAAPAPKGRTGAAASPAGDPADLSPSATLTTVPAARRPEVGEDLR